MGILDNISKSAKSFAEKAVKKTGEVAESAKLTICLKSEEVKLDELYEDLGRLTYEKADEVVITAQILEIDEQKLIIAQIKAEIAANNGKASCSSCGKDIPSEAAFCSYCGKQQAQKKNIAAEPPATSCETAGKSEAQSESCPKQDIKPLGTEEFVEFFKATMLKYGLAK